MQVLENILVVRLRQIFVSEPSYRDNIDWGEINQPIDEETFLKLYHKVLDYLDKKMNYTYLKATLVAIKIQC